MVKKKNRHWIEISIPDEIALIIAGFFGGILPGITIKTLVTLDPNDWSIMILKEICNITNGGIPFNCYSLVTIISLIVAFLTFLPVWEKAVQIKSIRIQDIIIPGFVLGLALYIIGFIFGILAIINLIAN